MPNAVTIDNYDVKIHERYALDQAGYDPKFLCDASEIPMHFEVVSTKENLVSKWEELFGIHLHHHPFAYFTPPPRYAMMRNRFFSYRISPEFDWGSLEDDDEEEREKEEQQAEIYKNKIKAKKSKIMPLALFERDQTALLKLIDSIHLLNGFLREVTARKLQYQKG